MQRKKVSNPVVKSNISLVELINQFIYLKQAQGVSERTLFDYQRTFKRFNKLSEEAINADISEIKPVLLKYFSSLNGTAPATFNVPYSNLNTFFTWAVNEEYLPKNPLKAIGLRKKRDEGRARHIEENAIRELLKAIDISTFAGLRDYAIVIFTLDTGIRPKEAFSLKISDIDFIHCTVCIRKEIAKTRTSRTLPITPQTAEILKRLQSVRLRDWEEFVFLTSEGYQMSVDRWGKRLLEYSNKIGFKITPYDLRHTFAIMFLRNNGNVFALQHEMGHADISMTKRYVNLAQCDLKEQHSAASPVNNFLRRTTRIQKLFK